MAVNVYEKLTGRSLTSVQTCYLGEDSLMIVSGLFQETVKHLRYEDIQATLICPTRSGGVFAFLGALGGIACMVMGLFQAGSAWLWVWLSFTAVLWMMAAYFMHQRGSARMGVQTAVQLVVLEGVTTLRKARRAEGRLARRVESVQGKLSAEALKAAHQKQREARIAVRTAAREANRRGRALSSTARPRSEAVPPPVPVQEAATPPPIRLQAEPNSTADQEARPL